MKMTGLANFEEMSDRYTGLTTPQETEKQTDVEFSICHLKKCNGYDILSTYSGLSRAEKSGTGKTQKRSN